ncbi:cobalamin receptor [Pasteurellaceae bacterium LFhippo2]|nr:cobalamin receptor [Pasteurellaceae bacterium LFhippo2]
MQKNLITTTLILSLSSIAFAEQQSQATQPTELQPINVYSAYAAPINQDKTASSVTVLTEKDFADRNATYVSDVLKTVPGVAMGANGGRGSTTSLFLRGANSQQTAIVIDGVKMNPADTNFSFGGLSLSNVERIEVLRGEQSALWGSDAMGGVVHITTKSGIYKDKPFNIDFNLGTGSNGTKDVSATISGFKNNFYYALNGNSQSTRGISVASKNHFTYTAADGNTIRTGGATERDKFHRDGASLRLGYDDNQKGLELLGSHYSQTFHNDGLTAGGDTAQGYSYSEDLAHSALRSRETLFKLSGYLGNDQDLFKQKASISHLKHDSDTFSLNVTTKDWKKLNSNYQLDINFDREGDVTQAVSLLADYQRTNYTSKYYNGVEKRLSEKSLATEYRLFTDSDHSLSVSGRFTDNSQYKNAWTGKIAGAYRLSPNFRAHAGLGSAIQNPNLMDYYGWDSKNVANPDIKPAKSVGGEIGLLIESNDKNHNLNVTYFARNVKNYIDSRETIPGSYIYQSYNRDDKTKIKGVELVYNGKLTDSLAAFANYTYTDIRSDKKKDQYGTNYIRRPSHSANAGLTYQVTDKFGTNANISYVGKRYDMYYGPFSTVTFTSYQTEVKMPSYTLVNLGANYQVSKNINVYANLNNLFNKKYESVVGYGQLGRNVYVGLKGSF